MWIAKLLIALFAAYGAIVLIAYVAQTSILFPTGLAGYAPPLPPGAERIAFDAPDGVRLHGVRIMPALSSAEGRTIVLGFGGNAWNAEHMAADLHKLFPAAEIVAFHYRGYPPSTGRPSAAALLRDAPLVYDFATRVRPPGPVVAVGFSIGSGVAAHLARERPLDGVILVTPFDTLEQLARQLYPWLPVGLLLHHHMAPADALRDVRAPVAIIAAEHDSIVPVQRTAPLKKAARKLVLDRTIEGAGHNDIYDKPEFARAMHQAMKLIQKCRSPACARNRP